jgi:hypothetical protein
VAAVTSFDPAAVPARITRLALSAIHREYPNHIALLATSDADLRPPRELTPAFFGAFDWHSAVHAHWTLARMARLHRDAAFADPAREALARSLTDAHLVAEHAYVGAAERAGFERPYGLAWLLQLEAELHGWQREGDADAGRWCAALGPLARIARQRIVSWLPRLTHPIRSGEHSQTAFALGLVLDAARATGERGVAEQVVERALAFHGADRDAPVAYEPSGHDFLSPALAEADLMRRVLEPAAFGEWLSGFLPDPHADHVARWLTPVVASDRADGKLAHFDGLNLSRAWMLEGITASLDAGHPAREVLAQAASHHAQAGLASIAGDEYAGTHWLGSFACYLVTRRGLDPR